jgi:CubicO group peptidase (beta-lactamase class C family)
MAALTDAFTAIRNECDAAVSAHVIPGAVVLCAIEGTTRFHEAFGARAIEPHRLPATSDTVYDIASVTKAVITSVLAMRAVAARAFALDDPVERYLPEFQGPGKSGVTVRHLLCHASGLPAHRPYYEQVAAGPQSRLQIALAAAREPLIGVPGAGSLYSDLGFILLGWLLERVAGLSLDVQAQRALIDPQGLASTAFVDLRDGAARDRLLERHAVAPTEDCPARGRIVLGEVHDLNAYAMGGVAGHAGLFSNAADLGRLAAALVSAWEGVITPDPIVEREVIREFWRPAGVPGSTWRLGWDGPASHGSQAGSRLSRAAVGHLGFTGCSLWIDPERALWIVLLSNRVHPTAREDPRFRAFRSAVHDAAIDGLSATPRPAPRPVPRPVGTD